MWAARDKKGFIGLFANKPQYWETEDMWLGDGQGYTKDTLSELTFDNSPQEVELKIKEK